MRSTPRISVNKLAEYITSRGIRQRQILRDQKFPQDFKVTYYKEAEEAVSQCIASNFENILSLERALSILEQRSPEKIGAARRIAKNADAIEIFSGMLDDIDLKGGIPELGEQFPSRMTIQGVEISVRPEIILRGQARDGHALLGAMKVHFPANVSFELRFCGRHFRNFAALYAGLPCAKRGRALRAVLLGC